MDSFWTALAAALESHEQPAGGDFLRQAAVLALITQEPQPSLVFAQRTFDSRHHAGEVCFPGGMWEPEDGSLLTTALRETYEEVGIPPESVTILGALRSRPTKSGTLVRPFVGVIPAASQFTLNRDELETLFQVPLMAFTQGLQIRMDTFVHQGKNIQIPAYLYQGFEIWGFTAGVTAELLRLAPVQQLLAALNEHANL